MDIRGNRADLFVRSRGAGRYEPRGELSVRLRIPFADHAGRSVYVHVRG